jgi:hypothetical protein
VLERLEWAGGNLGSFAEGTRAVEKMLELEISSAGLCALTEKLGRERASLRDSEVERFDKGELKSDYHEAPPVAAVAMDGGRAQVRASGAPRGVHEHAWTETKIADLSTYTDIRFLLDPQPEPPSEFLDPPKVLKLVRQMKGFSGRAHADDRSQGVKKGPGQWKKRKKRAKKRTKPRRKVRTVVATTRSCEQFGPMVAAEATRRGFFRAGKKAVLGDGSPWIWGIADFFFVGFTPILDFLHVLTHLYSAAKAPYTCDARGAWRLYVRLLRLGREGDEVAGGSPAARRQTGCTPEEVRRGRSAQDPGRDG